MSNSVRSFLVLMVLLVVVCAAGSAAADSGTIQLSGVIRDPSGDPVRDAVVELVSRDGSLTQRVITNADGEWSASAPSVSSIRIVAPGFRTRVVELNTMPAGEFIEIRLEPSMILSQDIVVSAVRAEERTPITKRDMRREEIEKSYYGQDVPALLSQTPSITTYSDSGLGGSGYSYFTLRGISQTRINMTLDGAPLNDPAENALYFANFTDFASSVESIQIQRGVGTSTVGSPSYGGSINFASISHLSEPQLSGSLSGGSFGTRRASVAYHSGDVGFGMSFYGRASVNESDGFRDRSGVRQHTFFLSGERRDDSSVTRLTAFSGREKSQLAFLAVEEDVLKQQPRFNPLSSDERDSFAQDFVQLQYIRALGKRSSLTGSLYYNGQPGWFTIWDDPAQRSNLLRYSIDGYFYGSMLNYSYRDERLDLTAGVHANRLSRDHFLHIDGIQQYTNHARKEELNAFTKAGYELGPWHLYADGQFRRAEFAYRGDVRIDPVSWSFFNPKLGVGYQRSPRWSAYLSAGAASREPARSDLLSGEDNASVAHDLRAVRPERVVDIEAGAAYRSGPWDGSINVYSMEFRNEIAATGELSEIGLPLRRNVARSFRRGVEIEVRYQLSPRWNLTHASSFSRNRIREWTQFLDVYDSGGSYAGNTARVYRNVAPLLTPEVVMNQRIEYVRPGGSVFFLAGRYVSESFLDNTNREKLVTPSFFNIDLSASLPLRRIWRTGAPALRIQLNNVLNNDRIYPSGYSYVFLQRDERSQLEEQGIPYFYPSATRNVLVSLEFRM